MDADTCGDVMTTKLERETIDGKPYFGVQVSNYIARPLPYDPYNDKEHLDYAKMMLYSWAESLHGERRHEELIYRPCNGGCNPLTQVETLGVKFLLWGRAYRIMRQLKKKGTRVRTKKRVNGRWKWR